jgi:hypothetical protein
MITGVGPEIESSLLDQLLTLYQNTSVWNVCTLHRLKCFSVNICWLVRHLLAGSSSVVITG